MSSFIIHALAPDEAAADMESSVAAAFDRCAAGLYRYLRVRLGDPHLADDLMQQLWLAAGKLDATPAPEVEFRLRAVARNLVRTHWRRQAGRPAHLPLPDPQLAAELAQRLVCEELPDEVLSRREVHEQLLLALTELPADEQTLILEHYFAGRSQVELAVQHNLTARAVEGRLYRARQALRRRLQHLERE